MYDLLIQHADLIDGSGGPRQRADIAIQGDRVARIGKIAPSEARQTLDAAGHVVSPGFVDVHNHSEGWLLKLGHVTPKTTQGFTSEVLMSDGISYAPVTEENWRDWITYLRTLNGLTLADYSGWRTVADYMELLDGRMAQNAVSQVPFANLKVAAGGWSRAVSDDTQLKQMQRELRTSMEAGACGLSTGLDYIVQCFSSTEEIAHVCRAMAPFSGIYVTHVRYKHGLMPALEEAVEIGRRAGVPVHISHLKAESVDTADELLAWIDNVSKDVDFSYDTYPYGPGSTMLNGLLPYEVWEEGPLHVAGRLREPAIRDRLEWLLEDYRCDPDHIRIAWVSGHDNRSLQGKTLGDLQRERGPRLADALADLLIEEQLAALAVYDIGDESLAEPMICHPKCMVSTDGIWHPEAHLHPRMYGSAPRVLGPWVRERGLFSLEEAVRKLTSWPAERFGFTDRGRLVEGAFADLVVFDPETVTDRATFADPLRYAEGIRDVLVNGVAVVRDGVPVELGEEMPGRSVRFHGE